MVLQVYSVTLPVGLIIYFSYGFRNSKLAQGSKAVGVSENAPAEV